MCQCSVKGKKVRVAKALYADDSVCGEFLVSFSLGVIFLSHWFYQFVCRQIKWRTGQNKLIAFCLPVIQQSKLMLFGWLSIVFMVTQHQVIFVSSLLECNFSLTSISMILFYFFQTKCIGHWAKLTKRKLWVWGGNQNPKQVNVPPCSIC